MARLVSWVTQHGAAFRSLALFVVGVTLTIALGAPAVRAQDCTSLLQMFRAGRNTTEIARITGLSTNEVASCRQELSGSAGASPFGAAGPAPHRAAGSPPMGAAGPPPIGAAGPPPMGAAGPPPIGRDVRRLP